MLNVMTHTELLSYGFCSPKRERPVPQQRKPIGGPADAMRHRNLHVHHIFGQCCMLCAVAGPAVGCSTPHTDLCWAAWTVKPTLKADVTLCSSTANEIASLMHNVGKQLSLGETVGQPAKPSLQNGVVSTEK